MNLKISKDLSLPADAATSTIIVYGGKGMGKTNLASVLVEEFAHAGIRFAVIDPMGVWWGLRHGADGKSLGIEVLILGGIHGDLPITPDSGALIADLVVDEDASVIIDISRHADGSMWSISERIRFVRDYVKRLYQRQGEKRRPLHQVIDEAARFAPQVVRQGESEVAACMGAVAILVEEGRNVGVGVTLVTQRSARLNKDVAELADCMIAFRIVGPNSMRAVLDWLGEHVEKARFKEISEQLRSLPRGSALVVSPGWLEFEGIVAMRMRTTFDSSATPKGGKQVRASGKGAKPDLSKYQERLAALVEEQKANDPKVLKARFAQLSKDFEKLRASKEKEFKVETKTVEKPLIKDSQIARLEVLFGKVELMRAKHAGELTSFVNATGELRQSLQTYKVTDNALKQRAVVEKIKIRKAGGLPIERIHSPGNQSVRTGVTSDAKSAPRVPGGRPTLTHQDSEQPTTTDGPISNAKLKILEACAWAHSIGLVTPDVGVVAFLAGYTLNGHYNNLRGQLHTAGLVDYPSSGTIQLTEAGQAVAPDVTRPVTTEELHRSVMARLDGAKRRILTPLIEAWPDTLTVGALADAAGFTVNGHFNNLRGKLRSLGLATYPSNGTVRAADLLFPEAT